MTLFSIVILRSEWTLICVWILVVVDIRRGRNIRQPLAMHFACGGIRNNMIKILRPRILWRYIAQVAHEYFLAVELHGSKIELVREAKKIKWTPPLSGWMRLNTNGASKNDLINGCGGLLRGYTSEWIGGFTIYLSSCSACIVEF